MTDSRHGAILSYMFNLGFLEMVAIGAIALIVIGPKQLPALARSLGHMLREFKKATADLSGGLLEIKEEFKKPMQESVAAINEAQEEFEASIDDESVEEPEAHPDSEAIADSENVNKQDDEEAKLKK